MAASVGALVACKARSQRHKPNKSAFDYFEGEITLKNHSANITPHQLIEGNIRIYTNKAVRHYGIRVQFEASIDVKYETKVDKGTVTKHRRVDNLVAGASELKEGNYIHSPIQHQIIGVPDENYEVSYTSAKFTITPGSYMYPFKIQYTGENLPSPFRNQYGTLHYKIAAYIRGEECYVSFAEKPLKFRGFSNLAEREETTEFIRNECWLYKSIFSFKKSVAAVLEVTNSQRGFLPGEEIGFVFKITNPKSYEIKHFSVLLIRRTICHIAGATNSKSTLASLANFETYEVSNATEIIWNGKLGIPKNSPTSYCSKNIYHVLYYLEYQAKVQGYSRQLKGHVKVWIGTTRDATSEITGRMSNVNVQISEGELHRTLSTMSNIPGSSVRPGPPDYSQLSSRVSSIVSITTLPPHYEDLINQNL